MDSKAKPFSLVLGGGALRGISHVGVLWALEEQGLIPDEIVGTSVGAVIGSLWAAGTSIESMREWGAALRQRDIFTLSKAALFKRGWNTPGLYDPSPLESLICKGVGKNMTFAETPHPLTIIATDLLRGRAAIFGRNSNSEAKVAEIAVASSSIAGLFPARAYEGMLLSDGMAVAPLPIEYALPNNLVVAVSMVGRTDRHEWEGGGAVELALRAHQIMARQLSISEIDRRPEAILVEPDVSRLPLMKLGQVDELIQAGYEAGRLACLSIQQAQQEAVNISDISNKSQEK